MKQPFFSRLVCLTLFTPVFHTAFCQQSTTAPVQQAPNMETTRPVEKMKTEFPFDIDLKDALGKVVNSAQLFGQRKKPLVLIFWLTTCGPCKMELTAIAQKYQGWKQEKDFDLYAISTDFSSRAEQFFARVRESNWPFPAFYDFNREFRQVMPGGLNGLPQVFVLQPSGAIAYKTRKYIPGDEDRLWEAIKALN